jgi:4-hydroxythreonine-4-phosphate dehydrogenase
MFLPRVGITMGDAAGIGPELCLWALADRKVRSVCRPVVLGSVDVLKAVARELKKRPRLMSAGTVEDLSPTDPCVLDLDNVDASLIVPGKVSSDCGRAAYEYVERAIQMATRGIIRAIVTAPLSKEAMSLAGVVHEGHTEILADLTGTSEFAMLQYSRDISVSFATTHIPLSAVVHDLSTDRIVEVGKLTARFLRRLNGKKPVLGVLGLNPHGSDGGLFGSEEQAVIEPAVAELQHEGVDARGPLVPDAAFVEDQRKIYDGYVAMYHDQGHIPFKILSFYEGVNVTLGLPIVRTSVNHGTAFDIAWEGKANPGSLREAILLAAKLCGSRK